MLPTALNIIFQAAATLQLNGEIGMRMQVVMSAWVCSTRARAHTHSSGVDVVCVHVCVCGTLIGYAWSEAAIAIPRTTPTRMRQAC